MTKKEVNQQNLSVKFKIKITKIKDIPVEKFPIRKVNLGVYSQMKSASNLVKYEKISLKEMEEALTELFYGKKEHINEHRKKLGLGD